MFKDEVNSQTEDIAPIILFDGLGFYKLPEIARILRDYHLYIQISSIRDRRGERGAPFFSPWNIYTQLINNLIIP